MTTVVGHELRNPLGAVMNSLYMLRRSLSDPAAAEPHLAVAERQTARAVNLAQDLTAYMREKEPELAPVELREVLDDVLEATPMPADVEVVLDVDSVALQADSKQLAQILTNLIDNAYQAMPEGGSLRIGAHADTDTVDHHSRGHRRGDRPDTGRPVLRALLHDEIGWDRSRPGHREAPDRGARWADRDRERETRWRHRHATSTSRTFERACMALDTKPRLFVTYAPRRRVTMSEYEDDAGGGSRPGSCRPDRPTGPARHQARWIVVPGPTR